jgi:hypothetical protein
MAAGTCIAGSAAKSPTPKGGKNARGGGKTIRQRAMEANCPAELVEHLHDADMQGLVIECVLHLLTANLAT